MLRVGLTGSIAVGKSFVSGVLAELGCHVVDADVVARHVVAPGAEGLRRIVEAFGAWVLRPDGTLDRTRVSAIVFKNKAKRELLNSMLHPLIIAEQDELLRRWEREDPRGVGVVDAALLIESGGHRRFDKLIVVHCRPEVQLQRLMLRNSLAREEAVARIAAQMPQEEKLRHADFKIDTSASFEEARRQTEEVYAALRRLADKGAAKR
ncbi:MAG: dephospho-CoA kinase [Pyrinomonadaceae bacterium]